MPEVKQSPDGFAIDPTGFLLDALGNPVKGRNGYYLFHYDDITKKWKQWSYAQGNWVPITCPPEQYRIGAPATYSQTITAVNQALSVQIPQENWRHNSMYVSVVVQLNSSGVRTVSSTYLATTQEDAAAMADAVAVNNRKIYPGTVYETYVGKLTHKIAPPAVTLTEIKD